MLGFVVALYPAIMGTLGAITILIVMARLGMRKFMGYPAILDVVIVLILGALFHGSYAGTIAAVIGGLVFSGLITVIRYAYGYETLTTKGWIKHEARINKSFSKIFRARHSNSN